MVEPLLRGVGLGKTYGSVLALDDVTLDFYQGSVHAIVGENGAGKTTLAGILGGFIKPSSGEVVAVGEEAGRTRGGVHMVHQHFTLVGDFTVAENFALAALKPALGRLDLDAAAKPALALARQLGWSLDPTLRVGELQVGVRQRIEVLKALVGDPSVLILDEPTAVLSQPEAAELLSLLAALRVRGVCIVLIAHKLREVLSIADRISVLRRGRLVASKAAQATSEAEIAELMLGSERSISIQAEAFSERSSNPEAGLEVAELEVISNEGGLAVRQVSFTAPAGVVTGVGGVEGNGQHELAEALARVRAAQRGQIEWKGMPSRVAYIPGDRHREGLALDISVTENLLVGSHRRPDFKLGPFLLWERIKQWAGALVAKFHIQTGDPGAPVSELSGGNQQKVVVARNLEKDPGLVVAVNPTRGLDFASARSVRSALRDAAQRGACVVLFSSDADELEEVSDKILYMGGGRLYLDPVEALGR